MRAKAWAAVRARFLGGFATAYIVVLAYAAYVNRQPAGTYSARAQAARVAPVFAAPLAGWAAFRLLAWLQALLDRRAARRVQQLEGKLRKQVRLARALCGLGQAASMLLQLRARTGSCLLATCSAHLPHPTRTQTQVTELKESMRYERTLALLRKYDPGERRGSRGAAGRREGETTAMLACGGGLRRGSCC